MSTPQKVFEGQMGSAAHHLVEVLGISADAAAKLAEEGFTDESVLAEVGVEDIAPVLGGDEDLAREIIEKVASLSGVESPHRLPRPEFFPTRIPLLLS